MSEPRHDLPWSWNGNEIVNAAGEAVAGIVPQETDETGEYIAEAVNLRARLEEMEREREEHPILGAMRSLTDGGLLVYRRPDGRDGYHVVDLSAERLQTALSAAFPTRIHPQGGR